MMHIPFNKPFLSGIEKKYIEEAVLTGKLSGNGKFTKLCHDFLQKKYSFKKCLLTTSCTDALEMAAFLIDIKPGDEVIVPSFTYVSTALAFASKGANIRFADSSAFSPNIDAEKLETLISPKTKAIVVMHYAGEACDMDFILKIASKYHLLVIEDAALAFDAQYHERALGSFGHLSTFSFHETKNIISGEGGLLVINDERFAERAEVLWEKGTNRVSFSEGKCNKYEWIDYGSSFLPSELTAAFLYGQLTQLSEIQARRMNAWKIYYQKLQFLQKRNKIILPQNTSNASMFYFIVSNKTFRDEIINYLESYGIHAVFHYLPLHLSPFYLKNNPVADLPNAVRYADCVVRLPFFTEITEFQQEYICTKIEDFFKKS